MKTLRTDFSDVDLGIRERFHKFAVDLGIRKAKMLDDITGRCLAAVSRTPYEVIEFFYALTRSKNVFLRRIGLGYLMVLMREFYCEILFLDGPRNGTSVCIAGQEWARVEIQFSDHIMFDTSARGDGPPAPFLILTELGRAKLGKLAPGS